MRAACEATSPVPPGDPAAIRAREQVADLLDPALLHLEEIGEVGIDEQLEHAERGLEAVVAHRDVFAHPATDVPVAEHHEVRVGETGLRLVAQHERRAERVDRGRRERFGPSAVHAQPELGQKPRVAKEETVRETGLHVARRERDRERRPFDERHDAAVTAQRRARGHRPRHGHKRARYRPLLRPPANRLGAVRYIRFPGAAVVNRSRESATDSEPRTVREVALPAARVPCPGRGSVVAEQPPSLARVASAGHACVGPSLLVRGSGLRARPARERRQHEHSRRQRLRPGTSRTCCAIRRCIAPDRRS